MSVYDIIQTDGIVCLCGSVRFREDFEREACTHTLMGYIVVMPNCWNHEIFHSERGKMAKERLDRLHLKKIDLCDIVFIINRDGYIGESTRREIAYAESKNKPICYMVGPESTADSTEDRSPDTQVTTGGDRLERTT